MNITITGQVRRAVASRFSDGRLGVRVVVAPGGEVPRGGTVVHAFLDFDPDADAERIRAKLLGAWVRLGGQALHALHNGTDVLLKGAVLTSPAMTDEEAALWRRTGSTPAEIEGVPV